MKTVRIPTNANPFVITINGAIYSYPAGTVQSVPDNIAEIIEQYNDSIPQEAEEQGEIGDVWTKTEEGAEWDKVKGLPEGGVSGQFLKKTSSGAGWSTIKEVPNGGTVGQVLTKTASGEEWANAQGGGVEAVNFYSQYEEAVHDSSKLPALVDDVCTAIDAGKIAYIQYTGNNTDDSNVTITGSMPIIKMADMRGAQMPFNFRAIGIITPKKSSDKLYLIVITNMDGESEYRESYVNFTSSGD